MERILLKLLPFMPSPVRGRVQRSMSAGVQAVKRTSFQGQMPKQLHSIWNGCAVLWLFSGAPEEHQTRTGMFQTSHGSVATYGVLYCTEDDTESSCRR